MSVFHTQDQRLMDIPPRKRTIKDRYAVGKKLRELCPREDHRLFKPDGRDPLPILTATDDSRLPVLLPLRYQRMSTSAFAFYRGTASLMAYDLSKMPSAPYLVQICGDAHLMNFGGFATPERRIVFGINDFDESYAGPFDWDLKRLVASFIVAGQYQSLSEEKCAQLAAEVVNSYRKMMRSLAKQTIIQSWYASTDFERSLEQDKNKRVSKLETQALQRAIQKDAHYDFEHMTEFVNGEPQIIEDYPLIFHPDTTIHPDFQASVRRRFTNYKESLPLERQVLLDRYEIVDSAMKVVGVGSVGTFCAMILLMGGDKDPLFLQLKEAGSSVVEDYFSHDKFATHGERVVYGQKLMQSAYDMLLGHFVGDSGRHYFVRQLHDVKIGVNIDKYRFKDMITYAQQCAWALAKSHARSGDPAIISGYIGSNDAFSSALTEFGFAYAKLCHEDYNTFLKAFEEEYFAKKLGATAEK